MFSKWLKTYQLLLIIHFRFTLQFSCNIATPLYLIEKNSHLYFYTIQNTNMKTKLNITLCLLYFKYFMKCNFKTMCNNKQIYSHTNYSISNQNISRRSTTNQVRGERKKNKRNETTEEPMEWSDVAIGTVSRQQLGLFTTLKLFTMLRSSWALCEVK